MLPPNSSEHLKFCPSTEDGEKTPQLSYRLLFRLLLFQKVLEDTFREHSVWRFWCYFLKSQWYKYNPYVTKLSFSPVRVHLQGLWSGLSSQCVMHMLQQAHPGARIWLGRSTIATRLLALGFSGVETRVRRSRHYHEHCCTLGLRLQFQVLGIPMHRSLYFHVAFLS